MADLRAAMAEAGLDPEEVRVVEVVDETDAGRLGFAGSPTIRVDGEDVEPPPPGERPGLACRVYRRGDGRISPLPDPEAVRAALAAGKVEA